MRPLRYPRVVCDRHGIQLSCYNVCHHVCSGTAAAHQSPANIEKPGWVLCKECSQCGEFATGKFSEWLSLTNPRLVCPLCAHQAGLISSPKVNL